MTADYRLNEAEGTVSLFNDQADGSVTGPFENVTGTAYTTDQPGQLKVARLRTKFLPRVMWLACLAIRSPSTLTLALPCSSALSTSGGV